MSISVLDVAIVCSAAGVSGGNDVDVVGVAAARLESLYPVAIDGSICEKLEHPDPVQRSIK
jgi:hypothetical protein